MNDELLITAEEPCPECGSFLLEIVYTTAGGFTKYQCKECSHDWLGE